MRGHFRWDGEAQFLEDRQVPRDRAPVHLELVGELADRRPVPQSLNASPDLEHAAHARETSTRPHSVRLPRAHGYRFFPRFAFVAGFVALAAAAVDAAAAFSSASTAASIFLRSTLKGAIILANRSA